MSVRPFHSFAIILTIFFTCLTASQLNAAEQLRACASNESKSGVVEKITKYNEVILIGGERLYLANILLSDASSEKNPLQFLIGKKVSYYFSGRKKDRHNRLLVQLLVNDQTSYWLQSSLVMEGKAQAIAIPNNINCAQLLLQSEKLARNSQRGEWGAGKNFKIVSVDDMKYLKRQPQGSFQIVRGKIVNVGRSASNVFLNFSDDWRQDFTAVISSRLIKRKDSQWPELKSLIGKTVLIRGWLDFWNGPMIRLHTPLMLEQESD